VEVKIMHRKIGPRNERIRIGDHVVIYPRGQRRIWTADYHDINKNGASRHVRQSLRTRNCRIAERRTASRTPYC
jgi:hypothetical protein